MQAEIIFLNGVSSAGKSSIAEALQVLLPDPFLHVGVDHFVGMMPRRYLGTAASATGFRWVLPEPGGAVGIEIRPGPVGRRVIAGYHRAVAALAAAGNNLIVDECLLAPGWLDDWLAVLPAEAVLFVGVQCPLEVVERREVERVERGERWKNSLGQARGHFGVAHAHGSYDLTVHTDRFTPEECARLIAAALPLPRSAFAQLRDQYEEKGTP